MSKLVGFITNKVKLKYYMIRRGNTVKGEGSGIVGEDIGGLEERGFTVFIKIY